MKKFTFPNKRNGCGGAYQDWLEVYLTSKCNGNCVWCIDRKGFHPTNEVEYTILADKIIKNKKTNIILLGGEPTLYRDIVPLTKTVSSYGKTIWITTNGSLMNKRFVEDKFRYIYGVNISVHSYNLSDNKEITGIELNKKDLMESIQTLHDNNSIVRLNCNCIKGYIDSVEKIETYINFSKEVGADKIRLAELRGYDSLFVNLTEIFNHQYGTTDDPFTEGCINDVVIHNIPVNIRQMCGLETSLRSKPINIARYSNINKEVLYYDGVIYNGWQENKEEGMSYYNEYDKEYELEKKVTRLEQEIVKMRRDLDKKREKKIVVY